MDQEHIRSALQDYFSSRSDIRLAMLYGSAAGDLFSGQSDVDIAVESADGEIPLDALFSMNAELQLLLHRDVDLVDIRTIGGLLHYKVFTKGILLKGFSTLLARHRIKALGFYEDFLPQLNAMKARRIERFYNGS
jgi:predicted nucleotidyltransferase